MIPNYSRVRLVSDGYGDQGGCYGMIGYVIEIHPGANYEVEFSDAAGVTVAQMVIGGNDLVVIPEDSPRE